jgi:hypothetical protein
LEVDAEERDALRLPLLRVRKTVPRKMATVTHNTPRLPQNTPLQPVTKTGNSESDPERSADIEPPLRARSLGSPVWVNLSRPSAAVKHLLHAHPCARFAS